MGVRIILGSTGGFLGAICLSVVLPVIAALFVKILRNPDLDWIGGVAFILGLLGGTLLGILGGLALTSRVTQKMGIGT